MATVAGECAAGRHGPRSRWGRVSALPSEYLVKLRKGRVVKHGPGLSVFVWPGESVTVLPTTIQRTAFRIDQVTAEKVGVEVTGVAVYRIADPMLAFRLLDFSDCSEGGEVLATTLREMFIGAARRLVAGMGVEECLTRRKESIAEELLREIQPVVSGRGRPEDTTDQGWGVVIDTIEIQDVRILSETVFSDLQAPYRADLRLEAQGCEVRMEEEIHLRQVEAERAEIDGDQALERRRSEIEEAGRMKAMERKERLQLAELKTRARTAEAAMVDDLKSREREAQLAAADSDLQLKRAELEDQVARRKAELDGALAVEVQRQQAEAARLETEALVEREEIEVAAAARSARMKLETERLQGEIRAAAQRGLRDVENSCPDERIRYELVTTALPAIAEAFVESMGPVHLTRISSGGEQGGDLGFLAEGLAQVLAVARSAGLDLGRIWGQGDDEVSPAP